MSKRVSLSTALGGISDARLLVLMRLRILVLICALLGFGNALAQALPNHVDPSAREVVPNLAPVPAIRFLTTADFPPFNYRDASGALVGFNIDLGRALCDLIGATCTIQAWPWEQAADALRDNQGDALLAGLALTPENGERFDFSQVYLALPARFVLRTEDAAEFSPEGLAGQSVSVRADSAHAQFLARYLPDALAVPFASELQALDALADGEVAAFFGDGLRASFWLGANPQCCRFAGDPYFRSDLFGEGMTVAFPAGHDAVRQAIDWGLVRLKRDGILDELYLRWFPVGFY